MAAPMQPLPIADTGSPALAGRTNLKDLSREELRRFVGTLGEPPYRGDQIFQWIYRRGAKGFAAMTDLSKAFRERLAAVATLAGPTVAAAPRSADGTRKLLLRLEDGEAIEAVLIPDEDRTTVCLSTQVGCPLACRFCATGDLGLKRDLAPHEIVDQFLIAQEVAGGRLDPAAPVEPQGENEGGRRSGGPPSRPERDRERRVTNVVLMGMGEPLLNYDATLKAVKVLTDPKGVGLGPKRITLSTVGILPKMIPFIEATGVHLAVSIHAPTDELRKELMPIDRKYPLDLVLETLRANRDKLDDRVFFEYVLLEGVNDDPEHARLLAEKIRGIPAKVNLLAFNPHEGSPFRRPSDERVERFKQELRDRGVDAYIRKSRGRDIAAACGQLALLESEGATVKGAAGA